MSVNLEINIYIYIFAPKFGICPRKVGKVLESEKIKICFKIVTFKRFQRKIVTSKQILFVLTYSPLFVMCIS